MAAYSWLDDDDTWIDVVLVLYIVDSVGSGDMSEDSQCPTYKYMYLSFQNAQFA